MKQNRRLIGALVALSSAFATYQATAQSQTTETPALQQVTVTARRVEENLQRVPVDVMAFSGDTLEKLNVTTVGALQFQVPSLVVTNGSEGGGQVAFGLRGLLDTSETSVSPTVVTYLDQVPVLGIMIARQMFDLESVQVLTGPQGTLFGATSNGGAILFTTHKPTDKYEGWAELTEGDYNLHQITGVWNLPLFATFQLRVAGEYVSRNGYTKQVNSCPHIIFGIAPPPTGGQVEPFGCQTHGDLNDESYKTIRVSSTWQVSKSIDNDSLFYSYYSGENGMAAIPYKIGGPQSLVDIDFFPGNPGGFPTGPETLAQQAQLGIRQVNTDGANWWDTRILGFSNITTVRLGDYFPGLGDLKFKNIYGYRQFKESFNTDNDGSILPLTYEQFQSAGAKKTNSDEVQFLGSLAHKQFSWILGGYFQHYKDPGYQPGGGDWLYYGTNAQVAQYQAIGLGCCFFAGSLANYFNVRNTSNTKAVYGNTDIDLSRLLRGLGVSAGVRETWVDSSAYTYAGEEPVCPFAPTSSSYVAPPCTQVSATSNSGTNWSASLNYQATNDVFLYFTSRHGFKPGGVNSAVKNPTYYTYAPESITDFELGLKSDLNIRGVPIRANFAVYQSNYWNQQRQEYVSQPPPLPVANVVLNAQKAQIRGAEANLTFLVTDNFNVRVVYDWLQAKFIEFTVPNPAGPGTLDFSDNAFPGAPENTVTVNTSYVLPFIDRTKGKITVMGDYYYRGPATYSEGDSIVHGPSVFNPGFSLVNARLIWEAAEQPLQITAAVTNLFNATFVVNNNDYTDSIVGWAHRWYGPPRMYELSVKYSFQAK